jgi:hypothetical protein
VIVVDATKSPERAAWRAWRRRLQGAVTRTLASPTPAATWKEALPSLNAAAERAVRLAHEHEFHVRGRSTTPTMFNEVLAERAQAQELVALIMGPKRCVQILYTAGVSFERAMQLLELVGPAVADALAFADVFNVIRLEDETRGAA